MGTDSKKRLCRICGKALSEYNQTDICWCHTEEQRTANLERKDGIIRLAGKTYIKGSENKSQWLWKNRWPKFEKNPVPPRTIRDWQNKGILPTEPDGSTDTTSMQIGNPNCDLLGLKDQATFTGLSERTLIRMEKDGRKCRGNQIGKINMYDSTSLWNFRKKPR